MVLDKFKLSYDQNTFSIFIINTPSMFELTFLPYLMEKISVQVDAIERMADPIDECMNSLFQGIKQVLSNILFYSKLFYMLNKIHLIADFRDK